MTIRDYGSWLWQTTFGSRSVTVERNDADEGVLVTVFDERTGKKARKTEVVLAADIAEAALRALLDEVAEHVRHDCAYGVSNRVRRLTLFREGARMVRMAIEPEDGGDEPEEPF